MSSGLHFIDIWFFEQEPLSLLCTLDCATIVSLCRFCWSIKAKSIKTTFWIDWYCSPSMLHQGDPSMVTPAEMHEATVMGHAAIAKATADRLKGIYEKFNAHEAELQRTGALKQARGRVPFHNLSPSPLFASTLSRNDVSVFFNMTTQMCNWMTVRHNMLHASRCPSRELQHQFPEITQLSVLVGYICAS